MLALPNPGIIAGPRVIAPSITARTAPDSQYLSVAAYDVTANAWLYDTDGANSTRQIYSLTKLLSALVVVEWVSNLDDTLTAISSDLTPTALWIPLQVGDVVSYRSLLKAALTAEAGDAIKMAGRGVGDRIFAATGTGTSGLTRFVEALNAKSAALGLSIVVDNPGGYEQFSNTGSARDCCILAGLVAANTTLQPMTTATTDTITITGPNARTVTLDDPAPYPGRSDVLLNHVGFFQDSAGTGDFATFLRHNYVVVWQAPNGNRIAICGLNSESQRVNGGFPARSIYRWDFDRFRTQLLADFPYLDPGATFPGTDPNFASVALLLSGDGGSLVDESPTPETITNAGLTFSEPLRAVGTRAIVGGVGQYAQIISPSADIVNFCNDASYTLEMWVRAEQNPTWEGAVIGFWNQNTGARSWRITFWVGYIGIEVCFASAPSTVEYRGTEFAGRFWGRNWHHVVWQRESGGLRYLYVNGGDYGVHASGPLVVPTGPLQIGGNTVAGGALGNFHRDGIDEIRITRGVARYPGGVFPTGIGRFPRA